MKKLLWVTLALVGFCVGFGCSSKPNIDTDAIIQEQVNTIDSILSTNVPVTTNFYEIDDSLDYIDFEARDLNFKGQHYRFILIWVREFGRYSNSGIAIIPLDEVDEITSNLDSISSFIGNKKDKTRQQIAYSSKGGLQITANSSPYGVENDTIPLYWRINILGTWKSNASQIIDKDDIFLVKDALIQGKEKLSSIN